MSAGYKTTTEERPFLAAQDKFDEMARHLELQGTLLMPHEVIEEYLVREGRELERRMLQEHLNLRAGAEVAVRVVDADGVVHDARRRGTRRLVSLVGEVSVSRLLYQASSKGSLSPQDASLNLPSESFSLGVRRRVGEEVASGSFDHVVDRLLTTTGAVVAKRQVEQLAQRAATDFGAFYSGRVVDSANEDGKLLVLTFDGAGIVMRTEDLRPATRRAAEKQANDPRWPPKRLNRGEKRNRKRMAQVAAVYAIDPYVREPEDIVRELRPVADASPTKARPRPVNKRVWASVQRAAAEVIAEAFDEALRRDPERRRRWVGLVDGNETQLNLAREAARRVGVEITIIVDLIHVLEYLWKAAYCLHQSGSKQAEQWVTARLRRLLEGVNPSDLAGGMSRSATLRGIEHRAALDACAGYLCKYRDFLHYDTAIADGLPIATGVIEGACRYLIRDRMDKTGARWSADGAEAVLQLRAICANGDFSAYWQQHVRAEYQRNHASQYASEVPSPLPGRPRLRVVK